MIQISKQRTPRSNNIIAIISIIIGLLLILINYDNFEHGNSYLFVAIAGTITGLLGIIVGISKLFFNRYYYLFGKWFCSVGLFMLFSYWLVDTKILYNPAIAFFGIFWTVAFVFLKRKQPKFSKRPLKLIVRQDLPTIAVVGLIITIVCFIPFENRLNIITSPNQAGASSFENDYYSIDVKGGFVYRINEPGTDNTEEVTVKQIAPDTVINFNAKTKTKLRLNVLNTPQQYEASMNNELLKTNPYLSGESLKISIDNNTAIEEDVIYSKNYTGSQKGTWTDLTLYPGLNQIEISPIESNKSLSFFVASDLHSGSSIYFAELIKMIRNKPNFIILNGDIVNYGVEPEYVVAGGLTEMSPVPIYTLIGNHENWQSGTRLYRDYFGPQTNSFVYKNSLFVFLDSSSGLVSDQQLSWLNDVLTSSDATHKFVFGHIPPLDPLNGTYDDGVYPNKELRLNLYDKDNSEKLIKILTENDANVFFGAHTHTHGSYKIKDTTFINTGALGGTVSAGDDVSYLRVTADDDIDIEKIDVQTPEQVAENGLGNKIHMIRIFAGPFLLDKAIRFNLVILLILLADFLIKKDRIKRLSTNMR